LLERTGYTLDVTTGQRKYGGPPPDSVYSGVQPGIGTEVSALYVGQDRSSILTVLSLELDSFPSVFIVIRRYPCIFCSHHKEG
jgi:hypothetical protein